MRASSSIVLSIAAPVAASADPPFFMSLFDRPSDAAGIAAMAISGDGEVVVGTINTPITQAFRWDRVSGLQILEGEFYPRDVSSDGSIVVGSFGSGLDHQAARWTQAGGYELLDMLSGDTFSDAYGVSSDGSTVVGVSVDFCLFGCYSHHRAFYTDQHARLRELPAAGSYPDARPVAVSADGSVVAGGSSRPDGSPLTANQACIWRNRNAFALGPPAPNSVASDISADGTVVVGVHSFAQGFDVFRWTESTAMVALGIGRANSVSIDAASAEVIVGGRARDSGDHEAFIWDAIRGARVLQEVLYGEFGLDLTGWTLLDATDVSDDGLTIVGNGLNPAGEYVAWIAHLGDGCGLPGDLNHDGAVALGDLADLLSHFGMQSGATYAEGDLDADGDVDLANLAALLANFGSVCP